MRNWWRRMATVLGLRSQPIYAWPGMDISLPEARRLHLVGSIHMGTRDMAPLPASLLLLLQQASALIVEADITVSAPLTNVTPVTVPLAERLDPERLEILRRVCEEYNLDETVFAELPPWHIALLLQARQAEALGLRAAYGIDYQLIQAAKAMNKPVMELEGPDEQIGRASCRDRVCT